MSLPRLLIVDDEPVHRAFATIVLGSVGWTVDEAEDGATALRAIAATRYDLVLLDIGLPDEDGLGIARTIREDQAIDPSVPILAFTSLNADAVARRAEAVGMDGYIAKPISAAELIERVSPWWPQPTSPTQMRLAAAFGAREMAALNNSFRAQLDDALERIDEPGIVALAHRIAGVAGTLGFMDVHATWLALSEGRDGARNRAAAAARRTLRLLSVAGD